MLKHKIEFNPLHEKGNTFAFYSKNTQKILSSSQTQLKIDSYEQIKNGFCNKNTGQKDRVEITQTKVSENHVIIASKNNVKQYRFSPLKFIKTINERSTNVEAIDISNTGLVAIGSQECDITIVNIYIPTASYTLQGHKVSSFNQNAVKELAFHPSGERLISASCDGLVKVWEIMDHSEEWHCVKSIDDLIQPSLPEDLIPNHIAWHPIGDIFAICGIQGDVHIVQNDTWIKKYTIRNDNSVHFIAFSPNGLYLLGLSQKTIMVWEVKSNSKPILQESHLHDLSSATWNPLDNEILLVQSMFNQCDKEGEVHCWKDFIPSSYPHPVKNSALMMDKGVEEDEKLFGDDDFDDDSLAKGLVDTQAMETGDNENENAAFDERNDLAAFEEDFINDNDFVVNDDNAGYNNDLSTEAGYAKNREDGVAMTRKQISGVHVGGGSSTRIDSFVHEEQALQKAFQPGSISTQGNRNYLVLNIIGTVCAIESNESYIYDIDFHENIARPFHFTDSTQYSMAALGSAGVVFASRYTSVNPSTIYFRLFDTWAAKNDWTLDLPENENAVAVAITSSAVVVATDREYLRFFSSSGVQTGIRCLPGIVLTMVGQDDLLFIVYHQAGVYQGRSSLGYLLLNTLTDSVVHTDCLPLAQNRSLKWVGFSTLGYPLIYDSDGVLCGLFMHSDFKWSPIFDSRIHRGEKKETYWAVGATETCFLCVICRGSKYPKFPKPVVLDLPLGMPLCQIESDTCKLEEKMARSKLILNHLRNSGVDDLIIGNKKKELDKYAIELFLHACQSEATQRALELTFGFHHLKSFEGAIKLASIKHLPALAERIANVQEVFQVDLDSVQEARRGGDDEAEC